MAWFFTCRNKKNKAQSVKTCLGWSEYQHDLMHGPRNLMRNRMCTCAYEGHNPWETVYINVLREGIKLSIIFFCNQQLCGIAIKGVFLSLGSHIWLGRLSSNFELDWFFKTNCFYKWNFRDANHFETIFCVPTCHVIWNCSKLKSIVY